MLMPRRVKHRKQHHPKRTGAAKGGTRLAFGEFGIQATEGSYVTNRQIESARIAMTRHIKRGGKVWINIYPDRPLTKNAKEAMRRAQHKLPMKTRFITREAGEF
jgi:large subunit ribosomal protein L16